MHIVIERVALAVAFFSWGVLAATAQQASEIPSAPIGSAQIPEQNVVTALGTSDTSDLLEQPLRGLCDVELKTKPVTEACEAAKLDLISLYAASAIAIEETSRRAAASRVDFDVQAQAHTLGALDDQAARSEILFWTAMATVALGLIAATLQFRFSWKSGLASAPTEIAISEKQVSIKTAWIGVVLLAMSMGFLALYLTLVYPNEPI